MADNSGNYQYKTGETVDTGKKFFDANGDPHTVYRRLVNCGALPNAGTKNVAHGASNVALDKPAGARLVYAASSTKLLGNHRDLTIEFDETNVDLVTGTNLSGYNPAIVEIEFCVDDENASS